MGSASLEIARRRQAGGLILVRCSLGEARASVRNSVSPKFGELCVDLADALHKFLIRQISIGMFRFNSKCRGISEATRRTNMVGCFVTIYSNARLRCSVHGPAKKPAVDGPAAAVADDGTMAGMLGRVRSQGHKGCQRIIRIKRGTVVLGVPFGAGAAHVMEFGPIGIEQASGQILQRFAQIDHHRVGSRSSSLSHGPLPAPSFPRPLSGQVVKKR
jgi:hypothetical protein